MFEIQRQTTKLGRGAISNMVTRAKYTSLQKVWTGQQWENKKNWPTETGRKHLQASQNKLTLAIYHVQVSCFTQMFEKSKCIKNGTLTFIINLVKNKAYTGIFKGYGEKHVLFCGWRTIAGPHEEAGWAEPRCSMRSPLLSLFHR